jgi:hypothetical protein
MEVQKASCQVCYSTAINLLTTDARKIEFLRTAVRWACWSLFISGDSIRIPVNPVSEGITEPLCSWGI